VSSAVVWFVVLADDDPVANQVVAVTPTLSVARSTTRRCARQPTVGALSPVADSARPMSGVATATARRKRLHAVADGVTV